MSSLEHLKVTLSRDGSVVHGSCFSLHKAKEAAAYVLPIKIERGELKIGVDRTDYCSFDYRDRPPEVSEYWGIPNKIAHVESPLFEEMYPSVGTSSKKFGLSVTTDSPTGIEFVSAKEIVERFCSGGGVTTELILGTLAAAEQHNIQLNIPLHPSKMTMGRWFQTIDDSCIDTESLLAWKRSIQSSYQIETLKASPPERPFLREIELDNSQSIVLRRGLDAVDVAAYAWHRGKLYMPIKIGVRPALLLDGNGEFLIIEGIAGSVEPGESGIDAYLQRALIETEEELSVQSIGEALCVGVSATLPEISPETATSVMVEVDPDAQIIRENGGDEVLERRWIEVDTLIEAGKSGLIHDPRLLLNAYLLKTSHRYHNPDADLSAYTGAVGIYGGTFDPLHNRHFGIAVEASSELDAVVIIPAKQNPLKEKTPTFPDDVRLEALLATAAQQERVYVSDAELKRVDSPSYTINTLRAAKEKLKPGTKLILISGSDVIPDLHKWNSIHDIFSLLDGWLVFERPGYSRSLLDALSDRLSPEEIQMLQDGWRVNCMSDISSTEMRRDRDTLTNNTPENAYRTYHNMTN